MLKYRRWANITRSLCILYPLFEGQKRYFNEFFQKIMRLCMINIQEKFVIKSRYDGAHSVMYIISDNSEIVVSELVGRCKYLASKIFHLIKTLFIWIPNQNQSKPMIVECVRCFLGLPDHLRILCFSYLHSKNHRLENGCVLRHISNMNFYLGLFWAVGAADRENNSNCHKYVTFEASFFTFS